MGLFDFLGNIFSGITGGISSLITKGLSFLGIGSGGAGGGILGSIESLFKGGFGNFLNGATSILTQVDGFVNKAANAVDSVLKPVTSVIDDVTKIANDIRDKLIIPVTNVIKGTEEATKSLITGLHNDLTEGLKGLVKIPSTIASALDSVDAVYQRASAELGSHIDSVVTDKLVPGLKESGAVPLADLGAALLPPVHKDTAKAVYEQKLALGEPPSVSDFNASFDRLKAAFGNVNGVFEQPLMALLSVYTELWSLFGAALNQKNAGEQGANLVNPIGTLGPGEAVEAVRRGLIASDQFFTEMARNGLDASRASTLYDIAQYLFSPRDAVELKYRELIDDATFATLMDQNNLSVGQSQTLVDMLGFLYGPGDAAALLARGVIDRQSYDRLTSANHMNQEDAQALIELRTSLASPQSMLKGHVRRAAVAEGFLADSLGTAPPQDVLDSYARNQVESAQADLDWLEHWRVPDMGTWIAAYFRGLITHTQLVTAADMNSVPREIIDVLVGVEEELPPTWLVPDIIASGVWGADKAIPQLMKLGFSQENATILYQYGESKIKTTAKAAAGDLSKLTLSTAATLYDDGVIDAQTYTQALLDHGYSADAATLQVELADIKNAAAKRKQFTDDLVAAVRVGALTRDQAQQQLYTAGFTNEQVILALDKIDAAKQQNNKLPSKAELDSLLKKGVIDDVVWIGTMEQLGYSAFWTQAFLQEIKGAA